MTANASARNPYIFGPPIRNREDFHGRAEEISLLVQCIAHGGCAAIVGERRIGKSSLLLHLQSEPPEVWPDAAMPLFVFINAQLLIRSESDLYAKVIQGIAQQTQAIRETLPRLSAEKSEQDLILCLEQLAPRRLALLIDEFEMICERPAFSEQFYLSLRAIAQNYGMSMVTATSVPLWECCAKGNGSSVFRNIFQDVRLGPFSEAETRDFVESGSRRSGVSLVRYLPQIVRLGGYLPAFVQLACSHYYEAVTRQPRLADKDHQDVQQRFAYQARSSFESIWHQYLSDSEKRAMQQLANGQCTAEPSLLHELGRKGYVIGKQIFSVVLAEMLAQSKGLDDPSLVPIRFDKQDEVWVNGAKISPPLTRSQQRLLKYLCENTERVCTKDEIASAVWGSVNLDMVDDERIAKLISRLRQRIEPNPKKPRYLVTTHGRGYRLSQQ
jgi:hypothetical protein